MSRAAARPSASAEPALLRLAVEAEDAAGALLADAANAVRGRVSANGDISAELLEREQHAVHGLAWLATYVEVVRQLSAYARRMGEAGRFGETERLLVTIGLGESLAQIFGGIPMSQGEIVRLSALGLAEERIEQRRTQAVRALIAEGTSAGARAHLVGFIEKSQGPVGDDGLDETLEAMRKEMRRFADEEVVPHAHGWHL
ncbi:MAG TPA: acyl-CoA dehydrogenase, partial [Xanthobacteraceae bacterium]|nr:acyl-CoA dehydrogenase [Xanthobacteraceae bacterium]